MSLEGGEREIGERLWEAGCHLLQVRRGWCGLVLVLVGGTVWVSRRMVLERGIRRDVGLDDASQTPDQLQLHLQTL